MNLLADRTAQLPCPLRLRFVSPGRIYALVLEQDLLGDWCVVQSWGGKRNLRGGGRVSAVESFYTGLSQVGTIRRCIKTMHRISNEYHFNIHLIFMKVLNRWKISHS